MLKRAVKSVIKQTFKDWELIIVDDYSQDATQKICEAFVRKDGRIRYVRRKSNFGKHTHPKNQGIKAARADYVAFLDDDNRYRRDHLQVLYKYKKNTDVVYGDRWLIDKTGRGRNAVGIRSDFNAQLLTRINFIDTSDVLVVKDRLLEVGGWDETLPVFADWNLWVRLTKLGCSFKHIPIIITDYYVHKGCNQFKHKTGIDPRTGSPLPSFKPDACKIWPDKTLFGSRPRLKVAIFTLTLDRLDYTKRMYKSMKKTAGYDFDWYVVDNRSKDETPEWLSGVFKRDDITGKILKNPKNLGISKASNQALEMIGNNYDIIIKVDNDCLFLTQGWLEEIVDFNERNRTMIVAPRVEGLRDSPGGVPRTSYIYIGRHFLGLAPHLGGICVAAPGRIYQSFQWDNEDFLHGEQDYIFSQHCIRLGFTLAYMENLIVEHMEGTKSQETKYPEYFEARRKQKITKYQLG